MKIKKNVYTFLFTILIGFIMFFFVTSCSEDDDSKNLDYGTISGIVTDEVGNPIEGVSVSVSGVEQTITTANDGSFVIDNVSIESHSVKFSKKSWESVSVTVTAKHFDKDRQAIIANTFMREAASKIIGKVYDSRNGNQPFAGVTVSVSPTKMVETASDGTFMIEDVRSIDHTITFSKEGYTPIIKKITENSFDNKIATVEDVYMGRVELLRGLTADDLALADKWYYNEYRGGRNGDAYPHWDWSTDYMSTLSFMGQWEEQNEGTTLQIRNSESQRNNPADLEIFDSYTYGSKSITADNKILSLRVRTHSTSDDAPAYFGVQVVDLSMEQPYAVKIGQVNTLNSGDYKDFHYDLSAYVGKEIVIAVGIYRQETGNYYKQLVLRAIRFADRNVVGWNWLPGTEIIPEWKLTQETVRSTMVNPKKIFTGISPISGNRDNYVDAYRSWRDVSHIASEWTLVPLKKDPEVFPSEGYIIKTRHDSEVSSIRPEAYLYSKFAIAAGNNKMTLKARNFSSNYTYFKLTVIKEDGTFYHIAPSSNTANDAQAANDGCWKFRHEDGGAGNPNAYASFVYDLSQFNGENVVIALGVYNCEPHSGENKLAIYNVNLQ